MVGGKLHLHFHRCPGFGDVTQAYTVSPDCNTITALGSAGNYKRVQKLDDEEVMGVTTDCKDDLGCSLNGVRKGGACVCDKPWTGASCGELSFVRSKLLQSLVPTWISASSWGASILASGPTFHIYASIITSVVNISEGLIFHGTSDDIEGPYAYDETPVGAAEGAEIIK